MSNLSFFTKDFIELICTINPLAIVILYLSMTPDTKEQIRLHMARKACWIAGGMLCFFSLTGEWFFQALHIGSYTFRIAGGIIIFFVGLKMLHNPDSGEEDGDEAASSGLYDISIIPLAIPMIAHPTAVTMLIQRHAAHYGLLRHFISTLAVLTATFTIYLLLLLACKGVRWLNPIVLKLSYRLSGLFLIAMAIQFFMVGMKESGLLHSALKDHISLPSSE
ncbi:MAG: MarC family protein [Puniceicoccales bacterium]|jgi:multiple antibiotic resistance protein|nr:MarC family protein [Puniceicoccales bacterium]